MAKRAARPKRQPHIPSRAPTYEAFERARAARDMREARRIIEAIVKRDPAWNDAQKLYAQFLFQDYGEAERAAETLEMLAGRAPDDPDVLAMKASVHVSLNEQEAAAACAEQSMARHPQIADAYQALWRVRPEMGELIERRIEEVLAARSVTEPQRLVFNALLGQIADKAGDYQRAFAAFSRANALRPGSYDPGAITHYFQEMMEVFSADYVAERSAIGASDAKPVFILGLPRSGSTLLERILSRHPKVDTAGERTDLTLVHEELRQRYFAPHAGGPRAASFIAELSKHDARAAAARYLTLIRPALKRPEAMRWLDKMPGNCMMIGLIKTILPKARIIYASRNPIDVALSCYVQSFNEGHAYTQSLERLAHYVFWTRLLMRHWGEALGEDLLEVRYEDVVADLEGQARRALDYLGLDWHEDCRAPQESDRPVVTASVSQVRQPIYGGSVERWRRYEPQLAPLFAAWRAMGDDVYREMTGAAAS